MSEWGWTKASEGPVPGRTVYRLTEPHPCSPPVGSECVLLASPRESGDAARACVEWLEEGSVQMVDVGVLTPVRSFATETCWSLMHADLRKMWRGKGPLLPSFYRDEPRGD